MTRPAWSISYGSAAIQVCRSERGAPWLIRVACRLSGGSRDPVDLCLLVEHTPLTLDNVLCGKSVNISRERTPMGALYFRLSPAGRRFHTWDGKEITLELLWTAASRADIDRPGGTGFARSPCLVLPDMLPILVEDPEMVGSDPPLSMPRIRYQGPLPIELSAGGISVPDWRGRATDEMLQVVVCETDAGDAELDDLGVTAATREISAAARQKAYEYASPLVEHIQSELESKQPVRPIICITHAGIGDVYPATGAYCPIPQAAVGGLTPDCGKVTYATSLLAQSWLGGGVRISGENAAEFSFSLGAALGLRFIELHESPEDFSSALSAAGRARGESLARDDAAVASRMRIMQLEILSGLRDRRFRQRLGKLISRNWGTYIRPEQLISLFHEFAVDLPFRLS